MGMSTEELGDIGELSRLLCVESIKERRKLRFNFKKLFV